MNAEKSNSGTTSEQTSSSGHATASGPTVTEAQFLDAQAEKAKAAIAATVADLKRGLAEGLSPLELAREHPWLSIGAGLVAGFATASALVPSKQQQALNHLRKIEAALHHPPPPAAHDAAKAGKDGVEAGGITAMLIKQLIGLVRPIAASVITSLLNAQAAPPPPPASEPQPAGHGADDPTSASA